MAAAAPLDQHGNASANGPFRQRRQAQAALPSQPPQPSATERARRAAAFLRCSRIQPIADLLAGTPGRPG